MKTYTCDKCGEKYQQKKKGMLTWRSPEMGVTLYKVEPMGTDDLITRNSLDFLKTVGDFCPTCTKRLQREIVLLLDFLEDE